MADYSIFFARSARKELEALSNSLIERILTKIELLSAEPRPVGAKKLQGNSNLWRIRIGDYWVLYSVDDVIKIIEIARVKHRREFYD